MTSEEKGIGKLLVESFSLLTKNLAELAKATFVLYLPALIGMISVCVLLAYRIVGDPEDFIQTKIFKHLLLYLPFMIPIWLINELYKVGIIKIVQSCDEKNRLGAFGAMKEALGIFTGYLWVLLLAIVKVLLWCLLFIIPGIIFCVLYALAPFAFILDKKRGHEALIHSKEMIKTSLGKFIGNYIVLTAVLLAVYLSTDFMIKRVFGVFVLGRVDLLSLLGAILKSLINIILGLYSIAFSYLLYKELKRRFETVSG